MGLRLVLLLLLSVGLLSAFITVSPMPGTFDVAYIYVSGPGFVVVVGVDDEPRNVTLFTEDGYKTWMKNNPGSAAYNGVIRKGDVLIIDVPPGIYVLAVYPIPIGAEAKMYAKSYSGWAPVGVMSLPREPLATSAAVGYFEVRSLKARGFKPGGGDVVNGTSIQLNAMVALELADGQRQYYFVQNALSLHTDAEKYKFVVNIFNGTSKSGSFTGVVRGNGKFYWHVSAPSFYGYATREKRYSLPFSGLLLINVSAAGGEARVDFGYNVGGGVVWYDSVAIKPYAPVVRAYILAGPLVTPFHAAASLELVLCGLDADSPRAVLDEVDVRLALLVRDGARWRPAPRIFNFGLNTAEKVSLNVETQLVNGMVLITKGTYKPQLLAEDLPETEIPPSNASAKAQIDDYLLLAALILLAFAAAYRRRKSRPLGRGGRLSAGLTPTWCL